jgi:hypothetical protein
MYRDRRISGPARGDREVVLDSEISGDTRPLAQASIRRFADPTSSGVVVYACSGHNRLIGGISQVAEQSGFGA